jgi:hypothetical protein
MRSDAERFVEVEGEVDRDQRLETERQHGEPNRPRRAPQPLGSCQTIAPVEQHTIAALRSGGKQRVPYRMAR